MGGGLAGGDQPELKIDRFVASSRDRGTFDLEFSFGWQLGLLGDGGCCYVGRFEFDGDHVRVEGERIRSVVCVVGERIGSGVARFRRITNVRVEHVDPGRNRERATGRRIDDYVGDLPDRAVHPRLQRDLGLGLRWKLPGDITTYGVLVRREHQPVVVFVALDDLVVRVDNRPDPIPAGDGVRHVDPLQRDRCLVQVDPTGGDAHAQIGRFGIVCVAVVDLVDQILRFDTSLYLEGVQQAETNLGANLDLFGLGFVPQRVGGGVDEVEVVVAVVGLEPDQGLADVFPVLTIEDPLLDAPFDLRVAGKVKRPFADVVKEAVERQHPDDFAVDIVEVSFDPDERGVADQVGKTHWPDRALGKPGRWGNRCAKRSKRNQGDGASNRQSTMLDPVMLKHQPARKADDDGDHHPLGGRPRQITCDVRKRQQAGRRHAR